MPGWLAKTNGLIILAFIAFLIVPVITRAATATYTSSTPTIEVPDNFSISDLDVTLNLDADIHALDVNLVSPADTRLGLSTRNRAFGTKFRNTILDDEASSGLTGSNGSWGGRFRPDQLTAGLDGASAQGTWTLELSYDPAFTPSLPIVLHNWTLTFQGADPAAISGTKYHDQNGDSVPDSSEPGLSGWTVYLDTNSNAQLDSGEPTATTDSDGRYQFSDLDVKDYIVRELFQPTWFQVTPRGNQLAVRTLSGQIAGSKDFGNILESETTASAYTSTTDVLIQDDGEAVRASSIINVSDSFPVVDVNVTIDANAPLSDTRVSLIGPDGTRVILFREGSTGVIGGSQFRSTTFDDQAPETIGDGDRPPFLDTYLPKEFLTALNQNSNGDWTLEALDTNPANGTTGEIFGWTLKLRTPTPAEPDEPDPIVLVPGIVVSQNKKLLYEDQAGEPWKFAFGYNVYKGLMKKLEQAGYEEGENLFVAHYDWRKPAAHNATQYLTPVIEQARQATGASKVDIIAHSFGGIVTRAYIQDDAYANNIDQVMTLGSPHSGAADAYVAWEGGIFPEGWDFFIKRRITIVEDALRDTRNQKDIQRPESFRAFFPSLRDMLPINDFVRRASELLPVSALTEQNTFLRNLQSTLASIATKGVRLTTIAGTDQATLDKVSLTNERSDEDKPLNRWRDGRANPLPPPLDSSEGDNRVLLSSAHLGTNIITINSVQHHKLPDESQDQIFETLGLEEQDSFFTDFPRRLFGITILSPIEASIEGPNGEILSKNRNDFGEDKAEYDDDPNDPDDPIDINIADLPIGEYKITYTGTGEGEYTIITTYADDSEIISTVREGHTGPGQVGTYSIRITDDSFLPPTTDVVTLICQLKQSTFDLLLQKHIKVKASKLHGMATRACSFAQNWQKQAEKSGEGSKDAKKWKQKTQQDYRQFAQELEKQIKTGNLDGNAIRKLTWLRDQIAGAGW